LANFITIIAESDFRYKQLTTDEARARAASFAGHSLRAGLATSAAMNDALDMPSSVAALAIRHNRAVHPRWWVAQTQCRRDGEFVTLGIE
jgi:hypothetical protein